MKLIGVIVVTALVATSTAIVCHEDMCKQICENSPTPQTCHALKKEYRPNSSMCGCCATCVDYARAFETCNRLPLSIKIHGGYPRVAKHCRPGLICYNYRCVIPPAA